MSKKKIAIIGHFGGREYFTDGQTVKTKILWDELSLATDRRLYRVDTYDRRHRPLRLLFRSLWAFLTAGDIVVLLSRNGMRMYFPILSFLSRVFGKRVYHDVIGGNLDASVTKYPKFKKYLNSFRVNWVETQGLKERMEAMGVTNCRVIPNFKRLDLQAIPAEGGFTEPYRFCTFSRVIREKGIEDAIAAVTAVNARHGRTVCRLDIYGKVDESYTEDFAKAVADAGETVCYKGVVPYDQSVKALSGYYALLFPTYWDGEGFPGTIVDAFSAGLPVIATRWNCNEEIITHGVNGFLYDRKTQSLADLLEKAMDGVGTWEAMQRNCLASARDFQPDRYIREMLREMEAAEKK